MEVVGPETYDGPALTVAIFCAFVAAILLVVGGAGRRRKRAGRALGGGAFGAARSGFAVAGDYLSAASLLGVCGAIAVSGHDGFLYPVGFLVAWLVALLLVAELMRNTGRFTMADILSFRLMRRRVRVATAVTTLAVCFFYLLAQLSAAGGLVSLMLGIESRTGQSIVIAVVGVLMIGYVLIGGMAGTTWMLIVKAVLLIAAATGIAVWVLAIHGFRVDRLLAAAVARSPDGDRILGPGLQYAADPLDFVSLGMALVLGTAGLPHIMRRFYDAPSARAARGSVVWAIWLIGGFCLLTLVLGYGAGGLVGAEAIMAAPGGVNSAAPLLALSLGGPVLLGFLCAVAFTTILSVVSGLTTTAASSFAQDFYARVVEPGKDGDAAPDPDGHVTVARRTVIVLGILAIIGGIAAQGQNIAFLIALAFAVAASANLPTILFSLYWRRFNTRGAVWSMYGGLAASVGLIFVSPVFSGSPTAMIPGIDIVVFPLDNPGIVSIPLGFLLAWLGAVTSRTRASRELAAEMEVRSLTGFGAEGKGAP